MVTLAVRVTRGRCYDHNFLQFFPIFGKKIGVFLNTNVVIKVLHNFALLRIKTPIFSLKFSAKIFLKSLHRSQIWRIFASWAIVYFGQILHTYSNYDYFS
jgi:hypothetical protein